MQTEIPTSQLCFVTPRHTNNAKIIFNAFIKKGTVRRYRSQVTVYIRHVKLAARGPHAAPLLAKCGPQLSNLIIKLLGTDFGTGKS